MRTRDFSWGKGGRCYGWRPITLAVPKVKKIRGLNLPTTACCGMTKKNGFIIKKTINYKRKFAFTSSTQRAVKGSLGTADPKARILNLSIRWMGRGSVVYWVRSRSAGRLSNRGSTAGRNKSFSSQVFRPTRGRTQSCTQWVWGRPSPEGKAVVVWG